MSFINYELLPTANLYLKKDKTDFMYFDKSKKIEEIEEMFTSDVNEDGDFDEGFFSTQIIFDYESSIDEKVLKVNNIDKVVGVDMLSEKDKEIEKGIILKYYAFVATMLIPYAGAITSVPSDLRDLFSDYEGTVETMKSYGVLSGEELNYIMDKSYFDNIAGFFGLIGTYFGAQGVVKTGKLSKAFLKLERLGLKTDEIFNQMGKYQKSFQEVIFNGKEVTKKSTSKIIDKITNFKKTKLEGNENIIKIFDISEIKKIIPTLGWSEKVELDLLLDLKDPNLVSYLRTQLDYLSKNLTKDEFSKIKITTSEKTKSIFNTEKEAIDARLNLIKSIKNISYEYNTKIYIKIEPSLIKNTDDVNKKPDLMSYYSIAEIIARASKNDMHEMLVLPNRTDIDNIGDISMIKNINNTNRFSQYDIIVYNAVQRFNAMRDPKLFLEDMYIAAKDSKEFSKWENETYGKKGKSGIGELIKIIDKKGWIGGNLDRKKFISSMWKSFDKIEYIPSREVKKLRKIGIDKSVNFLTKKIKKVLNENGLQLSSSSRLNKDGKPVFKNGSLENELEIKFIDNGVKGKDGLLDTTKLNSDFDGATNKSGFQIKVTLYDDNYDPYYGWLFIPLNDGKSGDFILPDFIYKKDVEVNISKMKENEINEAKVEILKGLSSKTENSIDSLLKISKYIDMNDLLRLEKEGVTLPEDIVSLYNNLINNGYYKRTTFYDFVINAPKDLRFFSILDKKTTIGLKGVTKYNEFSTSSQTFEKVPSNFVSVFHYTSISGLAKIAVDGLLPRGVSIEKDIYVAANASPINLKIAENYDKVAPKGFSRKNSVYAYPRKIIDGKENQGKGGICLELKVDPKKVLVADAEIVTEDSQFLTLSKKGTNVSGKEYWNKTMTLFEFNKLTKSQQDTLFIHPEIIIPEGVSTDYIKIIND